jgi:predicted acetylornithine/succinylornithine family transaminase
VTVPAPSSYLVQNYARAPISFVRGVGCHLFDAQGRRYLDAFAGVAVSSLGHGHAGLSAAIAEQARTLIHVSNHYLIPQQEQLAERIVTAAFPGQVLFCNSGTEANEAAYKLVRLWGNGVHQGRKTRMLAFQNSFHGRTLGSLSITAMAKYREPFAPLPQAEFLPFGDATALEAAFASAGDAVAGVFVETIQGEGGVLVPPTGYLERVRALCTRHGALLVCDEVQTGFTRTGKRFGYQHEGFVPDIMTMAKGLGGGVPIGAMLASPQIAALLTPGLHGTTFGGNPLACVAALTVTGQVLVPAFVQQVTERGDQLKAGLVRQFGASAVRGRGLLLGVQLESEPAALVAAARTQGLIVGPAGNRTLRLAPPLIISAAEVDELLERLAATVAQLGREPAPSARQSAPARPGH